MFFLLPVVHADESTEFVLMKITASAFDKAEMGKKFSVFIRGLNPLNMIDL